MGDVVLVLVIGGAWCAVLAMAVSLAAVASRADDGRRAMPTPPRPTPRRRPAFTERTPERDLPGRVPGEAPLSPSR
jgi:hypothetical protein